MPGALGEQRLRIVGIAHQCQHAGETGAASRVIDAIQFMQQFVDIRFVVAMRPGIARGIQAGRAMQGVHAQAGIVAERLTVAPAAAGRVPTFADLVATGEEVALPCDRLILALGFTGPDTRALVDQLGVALDRRGNLTTDARFATSVPGVYACGDAHRGQSLIVWAIAEGREAARHCDADLRGADSVLPARGVDQPFDR